MHEYKVTYESVRGHMERVYTCQDCGQRCDDQTWASHECAPAKPTTTKGKTEASVDEE